MESPVFLTCRTGKWSGSSDGTTWRNLSAEDWTGALLEMGEAFPGKLIVVVPPPRGRRRSAA